jgi:membrane protease YdiL (CAAX protease family)
VALALCWLYLNRRSIYASLTLHAGYNGLLLLLAWAATT